MVCNSSGLTNTPAQLATTIRLMGCVHTCVTETGDSLSDSQSLAEPSFHSLAFQPSLPAQHPGERSACKRTSALASNQCVPSSSTRCALCCITLRAASGANCRSSSSNKQWRQQQQQQGSRTAVQQLKATPPKHTRQRM